MSVKHVSHTREELLELIPLKLKTYPALAAGLLLKLFQGTPADNVHYALERLRADGIVLRAAIPTGKDIVAVYYHRTSTVFIEAFYNAQFGDRWSRY